MTKKGAKLYLHFLMAIIALMFTTITGCNNTKAHLDKSSNYVSHVNDTIKLSLYNVALGDSFFTVKEKFKNLLAVPLDSLSSYLPIEDNLKIVYEDLGISIYTTDTVFIANHEGWQHINNNGFYKGFPLKNTKHYTKLIFFIKDGRVFQSEMLITSTIIGVDDVELSQDDFIISIRNLYKEKYSNPDSIMLYNRKSRYAATYSIDTDSIIKEEIYNNVKESIDEYPPSISSSSIWSWKNANIIAEWDFQPYKHGQIWFWVTCPSIRIIYTDLSAVEAETKKRKEQIRLQKEDSLRKINRIEMENAERIKQQII